MRIRLSSIVRLRKRDYGPAQYMYLNEERVWVFDPAPADLDFPDTNGRGGDGLGKSLEVAGSWRSKKWQGPIFWLGWVTEFTSYIS